MCRRKCDSTWRAVEAELVRERERVEQLAAELAQARQRRGLFRRKG